MNKIKYTYNLGKAGTGIKRVTNACVENSNEVNFEFSDSFWVTMKSNVTDNVTNNRKNQITMTQLAKKLSVTKMTIVRDIARLKANNIIERIGPAKGGYWKIIE